MARRELAPPTAILLLEDDVDLAVQWATVFRRLGARVEIATTPAQAETWCTQLRFDLLILDLFMARPGGGYEPQGGVGLLSRIRTSVIPGIDSSYREIPIIVVSGSDARFGFDALTLAASMGASQVLRKPFAPRQLLALVEELIGPVRSAEG